MKNKKAGWYHFCEMDGFNGIEYLPDGVYGMANYGDYKHRPNAYGPFKTFSEAKKDAIAYFRTDVELARMRMRQAKNFKKPKGVK